MDFNNVNNGRNKRKSSVDLSTMVYGKVPPQVKDMEAAVLGAIMLEKEAFEDARNFIDEDCFYVDAHQRIFKAMKILREKMQPIDILTVCEQLKTTDDIDIVGGPHYVTKLTNSVVSSANIVPHSKKIFEKYIARNILKIGGEMIGMAYEDSENPFDLLDSADKMITSLKDMIALKSSTIPFRDVILNRVHEVIKNDGTAPAGLLSGFRELDSIILGFRPGLLYVIGARPGMGKTSFMEHLAKNIGGGVKGYSKPEPFGIISMETSDRDLADQHIANHSGINSLALKMGGLSEGDGRTLHGILPTIYEEKIYADFTPGLTIAEIVRIIRNWFKKFKIKGAAIDYTQIIEAEEKDERKTEVQLIGKILQTLLNLAKELNIAIIAFSQLNRDTLKNEGKKPNMANFSGAGKIEQIARAAMVIHRDEYYEIWEDDKGRSTKGIAEIIVLKNNGGNKGTARLKYEPQFSRFSDIISEENPLSNYIQVNAGFKPIEDDTPF